MTGGIDTIAAAAAALRSGATTSVRLVEAARARADSHDRWLGVFLRRFDEEALSAAEVADTELRLGVDRGPLHGVPIGVKDLLAAREGPTTAQSEVLPHDHWTGVDSTAVARLRQAGAVIVGKTTTMEFAVGSPDPAKPFPVPRNPWDTNRWAGGSSSGSASGLASGMFLGALGTDTGGSIRCPAAFCGVAGMKPSFGLLPTNGCLPLAPSMDHVGPLARGAADLAALMDALTREPGNSGLSGEFVATLDHQPERWRVGVVASVAHESGCADTAAAFDASLRAWQSLGADLVEVRLPFGPEVAAAATLVLAVEGITSHLRGLQTSWGRYFATTREHLLAGGSFDGIDYVSAQRLREAARSALHELFVDVDVVVGPTITGPAPTLAAIERVGLAAVMAGRGHTNYWNAVGNPVVAAPIGFAACGSPMSMQIAAPLGADKLALRALRAFESVTSWHQSAPPLDASVAPSPIDTSTPVVSSGEPANDALAAARMIVERLGVPASERELRALAAQYPRLRHVARIVRGGAGAIDARA